MKIEKRMMKEHYDKLEKMINEANKKFPILRRKFEDGRSTAMIYRWDLMAACDDQCWICNTLYKYLFDYHIDTALRKITNTK